MLAYSDGSLFAWWQTRTGSMYQYIHEDAMYRHVQFGSALLKERSNHCSLSMPCSLSREFVCSGPSYCPFD